MSFKFEFNQPADSSQHRYLEFDNTLPPQSLCSHIASHIVNRFGNSNYSTSALRKSRFLTLTVRDTPKGEERNVSIDFHAFADRIRSARTVPFQEFNLPAPNSQFFDSPLDLSRNFHFLSPNHNEAIKIQLQTPYGPNFPIKPSLDREGVAFTSFQRILHGNIKELRCKIVDDAEHITEIHPQWINSLRTMLSDCVSLIEITLHQLYFGAQYGYKSAWSFFPEKLGERHGRRIKDKLKWVGSICKRPLDDAAEEILALNKIREIRNHFSHLDPPCIAIATEEIAEWCNLVPIVGRLAAKIRERATEQLNAELVEIILAPKVLFVPRNDHPRVQLGSESGYRSSCWPPTS